MTFLEFARAHGLEINPSKFYPSERIHRCGTTAKPRSDNGAWFWDGRRGWVQDWASGGTVVWYREERQWTPEENRAYIDRKASQRADQDKEYERAAAKASEALQAARLDGHPYLVEKGFPRELGLVLEDRLLIPMRDAYSNALQGLQMIYREEGGWKKKMWPGMRAKGAVYQMGDSKTEAWLVEGYATGLSLRAALNQIRANATIIVCFSANNLTHIARKIPVDKKVFIFADNDQSQTGEKSAVEAGRPWTMADEVGFDANDIHQKKGIFALAKKVVELRNDYLY